MFLEYKVKRWFVSCCLQGGDPTVSRETYGFYPLVSLEILLMNLRIKKAFHEEVSCETLVRYKPAT